MLMSGSNSFYLLEGAYTAMKPDGAKRNITGTKLRARRAAALALSAALLAGGAAKAADLTWNAQDGTWFVGETPADPKNWQTGTVPNSAYFAAGDNAIFINAPGGTVTVSGEVQAGSISVTGGYSFVAQDSDAENNRLSAGTLTLDSSVVTLSVDTAVTGAATVGSTNLTLHRLLSVASYTQSQAHTDGGLLTIDRGRLVSAGGVSVKDVAHAARIIVKSADLSVAEGDAVGGAVSAGGSVSFDLVTGGSDNTGIVISSNRAKSTAGDAHGGAISASGADAEGVKINSNASLNIIGNTAEGAQNAGGGAVYAKSEAKSADVLLGAFGDYKLVISGNLASGDLGAYGGAVWAEGTSGKVELRGDKVTVLGNKALGGAGASGGAIFASGDIVVKNVNNGISIDQNFAEGNTTNDGSVRGGALYSGGSVELRSLGGTISLSGNVAANETGIAAGGALWTQGSADIGIRSQNTVKLEGNVARSKGSSASGGAIWAGSSVDLKGSAITLSANSADAKTDARGGAVYADGKVTLDSSGAITVQNNLAQAANGQARGGAIRAGSSVDLKGSAITLSANSADAQTDARGGAVYAAEGGVTLSAAGQVRLAGNLARGGDAYGSAVWASGDITITAGELFVQSNDVTGTGKTLYNYAGGAIYSDGGSVTLSADTVRLTGNSTSGITTWGGAVWASDAITIKGGSLAVLSNDATAPTPPTQMYEYADGGALYAEKGIVTLSADREVLVSGNLTSGDGVSGGAIYSGGAVKLESVAITLSANSARAKDTARGGAVYADHDVALTAENGGMITLTDNLAQATFDSARGGAICSYLGNVSLSADEVLVSANSAHVISVDSGSGAYGGAVWADRDITINAGALLTVQSNDATSMTAANGGDYDYLRRTGGGALYAQRIVTLSADTVVVTGNLASSDLGVAAFGGAVAAYNDITIKAGRLTLQSNDVSAKSGSASGGALYTEKGGVTLSADGQVLVAGNSASGGKEAFGGAVFA